MYCCMKHFPKKPVIITEKHPCKCQGLCLMRKFSKKNYESRHVKCKSLEISERTYKKTKDFLTGSYYEGDWSQERSMNGHGVYTFPNGVVYEGEFKDGEMHGKGELRYQTPNGPATIRGEWKDGIMTERTVLFDDNKLEYDGHDWHYCETPDRRYSKEYGEGLQPAGKSYLTAYHPSKEIPLGTNETDDGIYDQKRHVVYDYDDPTKMIRAPSHREQKWILENCRHGGKTVHVGPRPDLYEIYVEPTDLLETNQPPAAKYKSNDKTIDINMKLSTFEVDDDLVCSKEESNKMNEEQRAL